MKGFSIRTAAFSLFGALLFAQNAPRPADQQVQVFGPAEILTDTQGVDFDPYLKKVVQEVKANWYRLIPESAMPPVKKKGKLAIEFAILKDGNVSGMVLRASSGDVALDRAAWGGITASNPFSPLPKEFPGQNIGLRFYFYYNSPEDIRNVSLRPVQVEAGSSHQFTQVPEGGAATTAAWSVVGAGCSDRACGWITPEGLYTAPSKVPDPPTVVVKAVLLAEPSKSVSTIVTIVQPNPTRQESH